MILSYYDIIDKTKIYKILERFYIKYRKRRKFQSNPNGNTPPMLDSIHNIQMYKRTCVYSSEFQNNTIKEHLVIKIKSYPRQNDFYILNLVFEEYKDLL
jgi:hypothetical protein